LSWFEEGKVETRTLVIRDHKGPYLDEPKIRKDKRIDSWAESTKVP
jgi:hypothetical protein